MKTAMKFVKCLTVLVCLGVFLIGDKGGSANQNRAEYRLLCRTPHSYMLQDFDSGQTSIISPDHKSRVTLAKDFSFKVVREGREIGTILLSEDTDSNVQVIWAPDSEKLSVTYSDGGAIGAFRVHIYKISGNGIAEFAKPSRIAFNDFKKKYYCAVRGNNISTLGWTSDSRMAYLVTEVYPTSDCGTIWGKESGYLIDLDGNIIRHYDDKQTRAIEATCEKASRIVLQ